MSASSSAKPGSPVLPSYVLDLKSVITTNVVDNIIDFQFLHGYNQPTLLLLYEPLKTFSGYGGGALKKCCGERTCKIMFACVVSSRIAVRKDTCRMDVLTLDVKERISAFIWSKEVCVCTR